MAVIKVVAVEVHESALFAPTGLVGRWATSVARELKTHAKAQAPVSNRPNKSRANENEPVGSLKRGIHTSTTRTGPTSLSITLESRASYSIYVIKGTKTIFSRSARIPKGEPGAGQFVPVVFGEETQGGMYLPSNPGYGKAMMRQRVRGQKANDFLSRAVTMTAVKHESLRGFKMG